MPSKPLQGANSQVLLPFGTVPGGCPCSSARLLQLDGQSKRQVSRTAEPNICKALRTASAHCNPMTKDLRPLQVERSTRQRLQKQRPQLKQEASSQRPGHPHLCRAQVRSSCVNNLSTHAGLSMLLLPYPAFPSASASGRLHCRASFAFLETVPAIACCAQWFDTAENAMRSSFRARIRGPRIGQ